MTRKASFKPGDVVVLMSGGPAMTVDKCVAELVHCFWFRDDEMDAYSFPAATLQLQSDIEARRKARKNKADLPPKLPHHV